MCAALALNVVWKINNPVVTESSSLQMLNASNKIRRRLHHILDIQSYNETSVDVMPYKHTHVANNYLQLAPPMVSSVGIQHITTNILYKLSGQFLSPVCTAFVVSRTMYSLSFMLAYQKSKFIVLRLLTT